MASKFYAGMKNVVEVLNQMWEAFAAGPYNALPLTGGTLTGPVVSTARITATALVANTQIIAGANFAAGSSIRYANDGNPGALGIYYEVGAMSVAGIPGYGYPGRFWWSTTCGTAGVNAAGFRMVLRASDVQPAATTTNVLLAINGSGLLEVPTLCVGVSTSPGVRNEINRGGNMGNEILYVGQYGAPAPSVAVLASDGQGGWSASPSVLYAGKNSATNRSLSVPGTLNANGADYAEYLIKSLLCGTIIPGQIVGIDADGRLTDKWDRAITFMVKSTNPCMVGGDSWSQHLGARPTAPVRIAPTVEQVLVTPAVPADEANGTAAIPAVYDSITTAPGDTDNEWATKQAAHEAALAAFDAALEAARQTVDRIAFAGQVPVNVLGAAPGQYIVPVQDGDCIAGVAIDEDDMTLKQYFRAVGQVIAIEDDGRARIIVKAV